MQDKIYCLMNGGQSLSNEDRDILFHTARRIYHLNKKRQAVKTDTMEALITTKGEHTRLGGTVGIKFSATIATEKGQSNVEYIVRPCHLEPKELDSAIWGFIPQEVYRHLTELSAIGWN